MNYKLKAQVLTKEEVMGVSDGMMGLIESDSSEEYKLSVDIKGVKA